MKKIIIKGTLPEALVYVATCHKCKTRFTYQGSDITNDSRNESYVVCALDGCGAYVNADKPIVYKQGENYLDR